MKYILRELRYRIFLCSISGARTVRIEIINNNFYYLPVSYKTTRLIYSTSLIFSKLFFILCVMKEIMVSV